MSEAICDRCGCPYELRQQHGCRSCNPRRCALCNQPMGVLFDRVESRWHRGACNECAPPDSGR
jgi:hypothetical protein